MSELIRVILVMSISGGIVAVLLFGLKPLVKNRLPKSAQYYLWFVAIAALLTPVSIFIKLSPTTSAPLITAPSSMVSRYAITVEEELDRATEITAGLNETVNSNYNQALDQSESPISAVVTVFMLV